jgi:hypothetical protein
MKQTIESMPEPWYVKARLGERLYKCFISILAIIVMALVIPLLGIVMVIVMGLMFLLTLSLPFVSLITPDKIKTITPWYIEFKDSDYGLNLKRKKNV